VGDIPPVPLIPQQVDMGAVDGDSRAGKPLGRGSIGDNLDGRCGP